MQREYSLRLTRRQRDQRPSENHETKYEFNPRMAGETAVQSLNHCILNGLNEGKHLWRATGSTAIWRGVSRIQLNDLGSDFNNYGYCATSFDGASML